MKKWMNLQRRMQSWALGCLVLTITLAGCATTGVVDSNSFDADAFGIDSASSVTVERADGTLETAKAAVGG